jgi:hypothetical protein
VTGDIFGLARSVVINGSVKGGVTMAAQMVTLNGDIGSGVRLAGQTVVASGSIGRDLIAVGTDVSSTAKVNGDVIIGGSTALIGGTISGNVKAGAGQMTIRASVGGSVETTANRLTLGPTAAIKGNLTYTSENEAVVEPGARVSGATARKLPEDKTAGPANPVLKVLSEIPGKIVSFLMIFVLGLAAVFVATRNTRMLAQSVRQRPLPALGWGAAVTFGVPVAAIIVCITVIGLPAGLMSLAIWGMGLYLAQIPVALLLGLLILRRPAAAASRPVLLAALAIGLAILVAVTWVPWLNFFTGLAVSLLGLGAVVVLLRDTRAKTTQPAKP